eukprot:Amastigsp_a841847_15.p1 type:complete len:382 gc:universal Amastigsp_a841847_15:1543-398(-)
MEARLRSLGACRSRGTTLAISGLVLAWLAVFVIVVLAIGRRISRIDANLPLVSTWRPPPEDLVANGCTLVQKKTPFSARGLGFERARELANAVELGAANVSHAGQTPSAGDSRRRSCELHRVSRYRDPSRPLLSGPQVCVVARSYHKSLGATYAFLYSLFDSRYVPMRVYLLDSFPPAHRHDAAQRRNVSRSHAEAQDPLLLEILSEVNDCRVFVSPVNGELDWLTSIFGCFAEHPVPKFRSMFAYDRTEAELQRLLYRNAAVGRDDPRFCEYFLVTNSDNMYSAALFETALPALRLGRRVVHFNFTTHHEGYRTRNDAGIDLGAMFLHESLFAAGEPVLLTTDVLANRQAVHDADTLLQRRLRARGERFATLSEVLFMHQ